MRILAVAFFLTAVLTACGSRDVQHFDDDNPPAPNHVDTDRSPPPKRNFILVRGDLADQGSGVTASGVGAGPSNIHSSTIGGSYARAQITSPNFKLSSGVR